MQKNYRFSKKVQFDYSRGADFKVKFDSSKKHPYPIPHIGVKAPPLLPQVMSTLELDGYG